MGFKDLVDGGNIVQQETSKSEIQELLRVAARSLQDANAEGLSPEGRFALAYDAVLQLSTIPLRCKGYRTRGEGHHWAVFNALPDIMGDKTAEIADYFQTCRAKRSTAIYHQSSVVSRTEADELYKEAEEFDKLVRRWLKDEFPQYA
ncbi:MAG: SAV_6107 family HEPN domain-containing protein [Armatimonadota bacterium]